MNARKIASASFRLVAAHGNGITIGIALALLAVNLISLSYSRGITQDEVIHIPAGYYQMFRRDFQMNNVTPPAVKTLAALPAWLAGAHAAPTDNKLSGDSNRNFETLDYQSALSFWNANHTRFGAVLFSARLAAVLLTISLALMIFVFARQLFSVRAATLAVVLFSLEPNILAHGHIVHADIIAALAFLFFCFVLVNYWLYISFKWTVLLGLATGLALIAKFTLVPLAAVFIIALIVRGPRSRPSLKLSIVAKCVAIVVCLLVVNAAYFFQPRRPAESQSALSTAPGAVSALPNSMLRAISTLIPTDYLQGLTRLVKINEDGHEAYLLGKYSVRGWWYYYPLAFLFKATIPFLLLTVTASVWAVVRLVVHREKQFVPVLGGLLFYILLLMLSRINIGIRHLLPAFPFFFVLGGAAIDKLILSKRKWAVGCAILLIGFISFEAVRAYPAYMSYMNQLTATHPRWYYLGDSNLEWGQDISSLAAFLNGRGIKRVRGAMLCGEVAMPRYGIDYVNLLSSDHENAPGTEFIAIGANFLNGSLIPGNRDWFKSYRDRKPEAVFGESIYLYRLDQPEQESQTNR